MRSRLLRSTTYEIWTSKLPSVFIFLFSQPVLSSLLQKIQNAATANKQKMVLHQGVASKVREESKGGDTLV